jgi:transmembrane sensor
MSVGNNKDTLVLQQAVRWFAWLQEHNADPELMDVFRRWRAASEQHRIAYEKVESMWRACDGIDVFDLPWPSADELRLDNYDGSYTLPLPEHQNPLHDDLRIPAVAGSHLKTGEFVLGQRVSVKGHGLLLKTRSGWINAAIAASLLLFFSAVIAPWSYQRFFNDSPAVYITDVGQIQKQVLSDGSELTLGANSRVSVEFTRSQRKIVMERGEVFFEVSKDTNRPFVVAAGNGLVRAVGTVFNINKRDQSVTVSVVEGIVEVSRQVAESGSNPAINHPVQLEYAQQLVYDRAGAVWQAQQDEKILERATGWREGRLAYVNERLDAVLQDINRYSVRKLVLGDSALSELSYTGTVFSGNIDDWLRGLQQVFSIKVVETDKQILLLKS